MVKTFMQSTSIKLLHTNNYDPVCFQTESKTEDEKKENNKHLEFSDRKLNVIFVIYSSILIKAKNTSN